jgi:predicted permease
MFTDLRFALRQLRRSPGFALFVISTLAVGIGANTTIFGVVNALLIRPLPFQDSQQLIALTGAYKNRGADWSVSLPNAVDWGRRSRSFSGSGFYQSTSVTLAGNDRPERLEAVAVSSALLATLGLQPALGRVFTADETSPKGERVVLLSNALWQRRFAGDRGIIGRTVTLSGNPYTVIGVLARSQSFPHPDVQLYLPLRSDETTWNRASGGLQVVARMKPGVTMEQAQRDLDRVSKQLAAEFPKTNEELSAKVWSLRGQLYGGSDVSLVLYTLLGAVGFVLLIACVNVANLLLARATGREREVAVRAAIGASRQRVLNQLLTESLVLAFLGGAGGVLFSLWGVRLFARLIPADSGLPTDFRLDGRVLAFTAGLTLFTGLLFGAAPALNAARTDLTSLIGGRSGAGTRRRARARATLVVAQVALAAVLLVSAGLMIRSLNALLLTDPGFRPENLLTMRVMLDANYKSPEQTLSFQQRTLERLRTLPGVTAAGAVDWLPLGGTNNYNDIQLADRRDQKPENVGTVIVSAGYLNAMGIQLVKGRDFNATDTRSSPGAVIVNRTFAQKYFDRREPIGERILIGWEAGEKPYWRTVVGVVGDVKHSGLDKEQRTEIYVPFAQLPWTFSGMTFAVRTRTDPLALAQPAQAAIRAIDPNQAIYELKTMERVVRDSGSVFIARVLAGALGVFGLIALLLAALGLYGVISYGVAQRTYEIGALGATRADLTKLVMGQGLALVGVGLGIGLAGAVAATRVLSSALHGVTAHDPATFAQAALTLVGVAVLATLLPARRAARIDPAISLRSE